jgi:hypothetical protein
MQRATLNILETSTSNAIARWPPTAAAQAFSRRAGPGRVEAAYRELDAWLLCVARPARPAADPRRLQHGASGGLWLGARRASARLPEPDLRRQSEDGTPDRGPVGPLTTDARGDGARVGGSQRTGQVHLRAARLADPERRCVF